MLGNEKQAIRKPTIYLNVTNGKLEKYSKTGEKEAYSYLCGVLTNIKQVEREFKGQTLPYWYVNFEAEKEAYSVGFPYNNNVFKSIVLSLANKEEVDLTKEVKLSIYTAKERTKARITQGEKFIKWVEEPLPPLKEVTVGSKVVLDDTERMNFILNLVDVINLRTKTAI